MYKTRRKSKMTDSSTVVNDVELYRDLLEQHKRKDDLKSGQKLEGPDMTERMRKVGRRMATTEPENKRKAQNRDAQRAFRKRRETHVQALEAENNLMKAQLQKLQNELDRLKRRESATLSSASDTLPFNDAPDNSNLDSKTGREISCPAQCNSNAAPIPVTSTIKISKNYMLAKAIGTSDEHLRRDSDISSEVLSDSPEITADFSTAKLNEDDNITSQIMTVESITNCPKTTAELSALSYSSLSYPDTDSRCAGCETAYPADVLVKSNSKPDDNGVLEKSNRITDIPKQSNEQLVSADNPLDFFEESLFCWYRDSMNDSREYRDLKDTQTCSPQAADIPLSQDFEDVCDDCHQDCICPEQIPVDVAALCSDIECKFQVS